MSWLALGILVAAMPFLLAVCWAVQQRMAGRFAGCLVASLLAAAALGALFGYVGSRLTYDPHDVGPIGNWSGVVGLVIGFGAGWIAGAIAAPVVLLRLFGARVDAARLLVAVVSGSVVTAILFYVVEVERLGGGVPVVPMRILELVSSSATFSALVLASRERAGR